VLGARPLAKSVSFLMELKSKMMIKIIVSGLFVLFFNSSFAEPYKLVDFTCIPDVSYLKVRADGITINKHLFQGEHSEIKEIESNSNLNFVGWLYPLKKLCSINDIDIRVELEYQKTRNGRCGAAQSADLNVFFDDKKIIENARFGSMCSSPYAIQEMNFENLKEGWFEICGYYDKNGPYGDIYLCSTIYLSKIKNALPINIEEAFQKRMEHLDSVYGS